MRTWTFGKRLSTGFSIFMLTIPVLGPTLEKTFQILQRSCKRVLHVRVLYMNGSRGHVLLVSIQQARFDQELGSHRACFMTGDAGDSETGLLGAFDHVQRGEEYSSSGQAKSC